ncbi:MAG: ATP-binding protein [Rhodospirillales bacterium]
MDLDTIIALPPFVPFIAGLGAATLIILIVAYRPIRALLRDASAGETRHMLELLASAPDAMFAWPASVAGGIPGKEFHNRALIRLLDIPEGETASFEQLLERIGDADRPLLVKAADKMRETGEPFDILAAVGARQMHVAGRRAYVSGSDTEPAGDTLWFRDVTPFVEAVAQAQETAGDGAGSQAEEDRLRLILDAMPIPVWLRTPELDVAFANAAAGEDGAAVPPDARSMARTAQRTNQPQSAPLGLTLGGTRYRAEVVEAPLGPESGTIGFAAVSGGASDDLENALQLERSGLEQFLEQLTAAVAIYGPDRNLRAYNEAFAGLWQLDDMWLGRHPSLNQVLERLREMRRLPEFANFAEWRAEQLGHFDGMTEPARALMHLPDGRSLRTVVAPAVGGGLYHIFEDISDQLSIQREYKTLDAVQRRTIDNLQEAVAVFGSDGRLKLGNTLFGAMWGLDPEARDAEPHLGGIIEGMRQAGEDEAAWNERRQRLLGHVNARRPHRERLRRDDGRVIDWATVPLPDGALLVSFLDVTEEAQVEDALRARAEALEEAQKLSARFIADISYEVRTPMNTVTGFADALAQGYFGELNARQNEYVNGILATSQGLMSVLADILELAAIEAGTVELKKDSIDLHALLAGAMRLIKARAEAKELHLAFDVPTDIGWIAADERRLKQIIFNLLSNAVRFTPQRGGVQLSAQRAGGAKGEEIVITVSDTGIGIPQADIERVFDGFERDRRARDTDGNGQGGAGLGLTMVKSFVELHGGTVAIRSVPNRGTQVTCRLPATGTEGGDARDAFQP